MHHTIPFLLSRRASYNPVSSVTLCIIQFRFLRKRLTFCFCSQLQSWQGTNPLDLYSAPVIKSVSNDKKDLETQLKQLARAAQWLVLWLDCDREGENISFEVRRICSYFQGLALRLLLARLPSQELTVVHHDASCLNPKPAATSARFHKICSR